jgi:hypothetical protein
MVKPPPKHGWTRVPDGSGLDPDPAVVEKFQI